MYSTAVSLYHAVYLQVTVVKYRLMLLGRAAPVVNARLALTEAMWAQRTVAEAEDRH